MGLVKKIAMKGGDAKRSGARMQLTVNPMEPLVRPGSGAARPESCDEHIHIYVTQYCTDGAVFAETFTAEKLYVVKMVCGIRPNALYKLKQWGAACVAAGKLEGVQEFEDFEEIFACKYAWTGSQPPVLDEVRFAKNTTAFFVSGPEASLKDWLMHMDEMFHWRTTFSFEDMEQLKNEPSVRLHLSEVGFYLDKDEDAMKCDMQI